jgi:hypothetical protein
MMGPTAVTSIARVNLALPSVIILAAIYTGTETSIHIISRPAMTTRATSTSSACSKSCPNGNSNNISFQKATGFKRCRGSF